MTKNRFNYTDGAEITLNEIFQDIHFDEHTTWNNYKESWPIHYHLSPLRKNLLSWFNRFYNTTDKTALELGGGCGAITSYLTNYCNFSKITTVEGAEKRAELIKLRCGRAKHLQVINKNIIEFNTNDKYDLVLVIGVLEYSGKYIDDERPFNRFLAHAKSFLKEDGILILAIENQLGHKYLAGNHEDHYWTAFEGLSNYPNSVGIKTFDKGTLSNLLKSVGLDCQKWFYPFPDYKMPNVIFSDYGLNSSEFDWKPLLDTPTTDFSYKGRLKFNEKEFLKVLENTTSLNNFMNSFLVFASKTNKYTDDLNNIYAVKTNSLRRKEFCQMKVFLKSAEEILKVDTFSLYNSSNSKKETTPYYSGYLNMFEELTSAIYLKKYKEATKIVILWIELLNKYSLHSNITEIKSMFKEFSIQNFNYRAYNDEVAWLDSEYLDLIPYNILYRPIDYNLKIIDLEWSLFPTPIPKQFIIDRGMYFLMIKLNRILDIPIKKDDKWNLPSEICNQIPDMILKPDFLSLQFCETWFSNSVTSSTSALCEDSISRILNEYSSNEKMEISANVLIRLKSKLKSICKARF